MKNPWIWLVIWIVTMGGAYYIGMESDSSRAGGAAGDDADWAALEDENERLRKALESRGPILEVGTTGPRTADAEKGSAPGVAAGPSETRLGDEPVAAFDIQGAESADELLTGFLAHVKRLLAQGETGHLQLLKTMDELLNNKENQKKLEMLFGNEDEAARFIYPLIRFMVTNESSVVGLTETTFKTMANDPAKFEGYDKDTLEFFTEGVAFVLPGVVSEERLATFRGYAKKILDTPEEQQSEAVRKNRNDIERLMRIWAPRLSPEDAVAKLRTGDVTPQEAAALLAKLPPDLLSEVDAARWLGPMIEKGDYRSIRALRRMRLTAGQRAQFDQHFLTGAEKGQIHEWMVRYYLQNTGRASWADARDFVEQGLNQGGRAVDAFAGSITHLGEKPDADWVRWALDRYTISKHVRSRLKSTFKLD